MANNNHTLSDCVNEYLAQRNISGRKYYAGYLLASRWAWRELFKNTIYSVQSEWMELKAGVPYNYIDVPRGMVRLFTVSEQDSCGNIVPLFYNNQLNIIQKPLKSTCGCEFCDCQNPLCGNTELGVTKTTRLLFTINNVDYYEVTYLKLCSNGDIIEYKEIPTKKYNTFSGDGGDYNSDYNNDYLIAHPPFADYSIETVIEQKILCNVELKPCGCPKDIPENVNKINNCCGHLFEWRKRCEMPIGDVDDNGRGHVKMSECGTKIYFKPSPKRHIFCVGEPELPSHLLVNYQTSGEDCSTAVIVPEYAIDTMFYGIDWYSKRFNLALTKAESSECR